MTESKPPDMGDESADGAGDAQAAGSPAARGKATGSPTRHRSRETGSSSLPPSLESASPESTATRDSVAIGRVLNGQYRLEEHLGGGGMGDVYIARDLLAEANLDPDPFVAVKVLSAALRGDSDATRGLQREARRAQQLSHENIVRVHHFGRDDDTNYLTMELLRGQSFDRIVADHPDGLPLVEALPLIEGMCRGLSFAHRQGIIHSDIKPNNVFLTDEAVVKILDFGIAMPLRQVGTGSGETKYNPRRLGALSPRYSAVEVYMGLDADPRDDVFSAGCVVYELLSGTHPYQGEEAPRALERGLEPKAIRSLTNKQNRALRGALALERQSRTGSIEAFVTAFTAQSGGTAPMLLWGVPAALVVFGAVIFGAWLFTREDPVPEPEDTDKPVIASTPSTSTTTPSNTTTPSDPVADTQLPSDTQPYSPTVDLPTTTDPDVPRADASDSQVPRTEGECGSLEERWGTLSCSGRKACFANRAQEARFATVLAPANLKPMYTARMEMYQRLEKSTCTEQESARTREYSQFERNFPGYTVR